MTDFGIEVDIQAPADVVWAVMRDVERWFEWTASITSVRILDGKPLAVGSRALVRQPKLLPAKWLVTELDDPGRNFTWVSSGPGLHVVARHLVEARGTGSRATLSIRFSGVLAGFFARILRGLNNRYLALEANGLKRRSEGSRSDTSGP